MSLVWRVVRGEERIVRCAELLGRSAIDNLMNLNLTNVRTFFELFLATTEDISLFRKLDLSSSSVLSAAVCC